MSLRAKLRALFLLAGVITVLLAGAVWFHGDARAGREAEERRLTLLAEVVAAELGPILDSAPEELEARLEAHVRRPGILRMGIFDARCARRASLSVDAVASSEPLEMGELGTSFTPESLVVRVPIESRGERLGLLAIESDLRFLHARQVELLRAFLFVTAASLLVSLALSYGLQGSVLAPIRDLVAAAHAVSKKRDHSTRARPRGNDELGALARDFNAMLEGIEQRSRELEVTRATLEA